MKNNYTATLISTVAISLAISSCSPLKPDHPQQFSDFKDRRAPRDNQLASSGSLGQSEDQKKSGFTAYTGGTQKDDKSGSNTPASANANPAVKSEAPQSNDKGDKSDSGSFFDRLFKKMSLNTSNSVQQVAILDERRSPKDNYVDEDIAGQFGQGSSSGASYYDIADEIISPTQVQEVIKISANTETLVVKPNPSSSLVEVPALPSAEEVKQQSSQITTKPELSQVPPKPEQFNQPMVPVQTTPKPIQQIQLDQPQPTEEKTVVEKLATPVKMPAVKAKKEKKAIEKPNINRHVTAYNYTDDKIDIKDVIIKDKAAKVLYENGHPIVSGELGAKNTDNN